MAAPTIARTVSLSNATASSLTLTAGTALLVDGTNTLLVCFVGGGHSTQATRTATSVTHHGDALTKLCEADDGSWDCQQIWYRIAPDDGTWDIVATWPSGVQSGIGAILVNGAHQTVPFGTPVTGGATDQSNTITVLSATDEIIVSSTGTDDQTGITAGKTQLYQETGIGSDSTQGAQWTAGAASVAMAWTQDIDNWASCGVGIKPVASSASVVPVLMRQFRERRS